MTKFFGYKQLNHIIELLKYHKKNCNAGNPFSAAIIHKIDADFFICDNIVYLNNDNTAHAEMEALRKLRAYNWHPKDCFIISSGEPCGMCLFAIAWSGIKEVFYLDSYKVARKRGFKFDGNAKRINRQNKLGLTIKQIK